MSATLSLSAPERSLEQRLVALEKANRIRSQRARLKVDIKAGDVSPVALVCDPPEYALTMKAMDALLAVPKWGQVKVLTTMRRSEVSASKTLGGLSTRQRLALSVALGARRRV